ncbi:helix-turn-helix domain-containing protein [Propionicimonas sp.]|uniref:helix-turn-helix domain-containing protein n=1 Tax=Propionicimonas sp. TaxID=1955623 RepID=UPI0039E6BC8F
MALTRTFIPLVTFGAVVPVSGWEAALMYGVSVDTLRRRIAHGHLPASRFGGRLIRVRIEDLEGLFLPIPTVRPIHRRLG